ncbi:hypothetical protein F4780DRAFT_164189 [Xylariomycetidae sp. FL0641]|nr:hypothetical protein F4780DRAFT_164189 [Xylariomycetidae sp. FL0641]
MESTGETDVTEVYDSMPGFVRATHWSKPYYSALLHNNPQLHSHLFEHVNCSYFSTPGRPPTLLALKQHAQSLACMIQLLAPSQLGASINNNVRQGNAEFAAEQAFDWLLNLQQHYNSDDNAHKKPLNALVNLVKSNSDSTGPKWHCPLEKVGLEFPEKHPAQQFRPFQSHLTLLMHANEALERLDHEYSAMGGLLSIIPLDSADLPEEDALAKAKTTLVGQWILYTQHLVARMHELEIAYGNCLDLLANEAVVPMQHMSVHGPDGRSGREIIFPQDRWVLANAGEDVFTFIHRLLDQREAVQDQRDKIYDEQQVMGDAGRRDDDENLSRGIVKVDLSTRFYRLRRSGHGPVFVLPAFGDRPHTAHTRDMENRPTVVAVPQPSVPEPTSEWDRKHANLESELLKAQSQASLLESKKNTLEANNVWLEGRIQNLERFVTAYETEGGQDLSAAIRKNAELESTVSQGQSRLQKCESERQLLEFEVNAFRAANQQSREGSDSIAGLAAQIRDLREARQKFEGELDQQKALNKKLEGDMSLLRLSHSAIKSQRDELANRGGGVGGPGQETGGNAAVSGARIKELEKKLEDANKRAEQAESQRQLARTELDSTKKQAEDWKKKYEGCRTEKTQVSVVNVEAPLPGQTHYLDREKNMVVCSIDHYETLQKERDSFEGEVAESAAQNQVYREEIEGLKASHRDLSANLSNAPDFWNLKEENLKLRMDGSGWYEKMKEYRERVKLLEAELKAQKQPGGDATQDGNPAQLQAQVARLTWELWTARKDAQENAERMAEDCRQKTDFYIRVSNEVKASSILLPDGFPEHENSTYEDAKKGMMVCPVAHFKRLSQRAQGGSNSTTGDKLDLPADFPKEADSTYTITANGKQLIICKPEYLKDLRQETNVGEQQKKLEEEKKKLEEQKKKLEEEKKKLEEQKKKLEEQLRTALAERQQGTNVGEQQKRLEEQKKKLEEQLQTALTERQQKEDEGKVTAEKLANLEAQLQSTKAQLQSTEARLQGTSQQPHGNVIYLPEGFPQGPEYIYHDRPKDLVVLTSDHLKTLAVSEVKRKADQEALKKAQEDLQKCAKDLQDCRASPAGQQGKVINLPPGFQDHYNSRYEDPEQNAVVCRLDFFRDVVLRGATNANADAAPQPPAEVAALQAELAALRARQVVELPEDWTEEAHGSRYDDPEQGLAVVTISYLDLLEAAGDDAEDLRVGMAEASRQLEACRLDNGKLKEQLEQCQQQQQQQQQVQTQNPPAGPTEDEQLYRNLTDALTTQLNRAFQKAEAQDAKLRAALSERDALQAQLNDMVAQLQATVQAALSERDALQAQLNDMEHPDVAQLQATVQAALSERDALQAQLNDMEHPDVAQLQATIKDLRQKLARLMRIVNTFKDFEGQTRELLNLTDAQISNLEQEQTDDNASDQ